MYRDPESGRQPPFSAPADMRQPVHSAEAVYGRDEQQHTDGVPGNMNARRMSGLKAWQQDVWEGPVPTDQNPFDEPEDAPELLSERSENLNNRQGDFWQSQTTGYQITRETPVTGSSGKKKEPGRQRKKRIATTAVILLVLAAIVLILRFAVLTVREIEIIGNSAVSTSEIIRLSGIARGDAILGVRDDQVAQGLSRNRYIVLKYVEKQLPGKVVICVKEREACCWMTYCGIMYAMDKNRIILEEGEDPNIAPPESLIKVTGLDIRSGCMTGQTLILNSAEQEQLFTELFLEMKITGCAGSVSEVNLADPGSVLLTMRNGITVKMGDRTRLHAKLRALTLTLSKLESMDLHGGIINVSVPESPVYSPGDV